MAFRFRRSIRILPGVRFNMSKRGTSWSFGRRGASVNVSSRGVKQTVGIPGTGLSYSTFSPAARRGVTPEPTVAVLRDPAPHRATSVAADYARLEIPETSSRRKILFVGSVLIAAGISGSIAGALLVPDDTTLYIVLPFAVIFVGILTVVTGLAMASRASLFTRELARRRDEFTRAVKAIDTSDLKQVNAVFALKERLHLRDDEVDPRYLTIAGGVQDVLTYQKEVAQNGNRFPPLEGIGEPVTADEECYLVAAVSVDARGQHGPARVYLTNARLVIQGEQVTSIPWSKIGTFANEGFICRVQRLDRQTAMIIRFDVLGAALRADLLAKNLCRRIES